MTVTKILVLVTKIITKKLSYSYQKGFRTKKNYHMVLGMMVTKNLVLVTKLVSRSVIVTKNGFSFKKVL